MKKRRKKIGGDFSLKGVKRQKDTRSQILEMEPEELVRYVCRAEKQAIPIIREKRVGPGAAQLLLALYTQTLVTGKAGFSAESGMSIANRILTIWRAGYYTPGPEYPYTLEETLQDIGHGLVGNEGYAACFMPFTSSTGSIPAGLGRAAGGIVRHPETLLWQIWLMFEGAYADIGAFRDPEKALRNLEEIITTSRRGGSFTEAEMLSRKVLARADGPAKQLPSEMMSYLREHIDQFEIEL